ncbi:MAG: hypothetical protein GXO55_09055 [Chloroflexi bacterium]|nr:hypothetical protein [Chloroflexota bacterium]
MRGKARGVSTTIRWLLQAATGILLLLLLGVHMVANHFIAEGGIRTYDQVIAYLSHPVIWTWEALFLIIVTFHAMLGVRSVLFDLGPSPEAEKKINLGVAIGGIGAIVYGLWLLSQLR